MAKFVRRSTSIVFGAVFSALLFWLTRAPAAWWALIFLILWIAVVAFVQIRLRCICNHRTNLGGITVFATMSTSALATVVETPAAVACVTALGGVMLGYLLWVAFTPFEQDALAYPVVRRIVAAITAFGAYGFTVIHFAAVIFFPGIPSILWALSLGFFFLLATVLAWQLYGKISLANDWLPLSASATAMAELAVAMRLLPFGYFASALLLVWLWYIVQLLGRFHRSPQGILWAKQRRFLVINAFLYLIVFTMYTRWI